MRSLLRHLRWAFFGPRDDCDCGDECHNRFYFVRRDLRRLIHREEG